MKMRIKRPLILLLVIMLCTFVLYSCANNHAYSDAIETYLKDKYGCDFVVHEVTEEFSENDGSYIRAICESSEYAGEFPILFCYPDGQRTGDKITLGGTEYVVVGDYADVVFLHQFKQQFRAKVGETLFIKCQFAVFDHTVYIVANETEAGDREAIEKALGECPLENYGYRCYMYFF